MGAAPRQRSAAGLDAANLPDFRNPECDSYCGTRRRTIKYPLFFGNLEFQL